MSTLKEIEEVNKEAAEDPVIKELAQGLDKAEKMKILGQTEAGQALVEQLSKETRALMNEMFQVVRLAEEKKLIPIISQINANLNVINQILGAGNEAKDLFSILTERLTKYK